MVPQAMSLPFWMMPMRWQISSATLMLWVERKIVVPFFASARKRSLSVRAPLRVHAHHRLVDDQDARFMDQRGADDQALFHAVRIAFHELVLPSAQLQMVEQLRYALFQVVCDSMRCSLPTKCKNSLPLSFS